MKARVCLILLLGFVLGALLGSAKVIPAQSGDLALTHVTIINPGAAKPQPEMTILIHGSNIASVGKTKLLKLPASAKVIDATGKFVIPGLWDMHTHFRDPDRDLKMYIANGVLRIATWAARTSWYFLCATQSLPANASVPGSLPAVRSSRQHPELPGRIRIHGLGKFRRRSPRHRALPQTTRAPDFPELKVYDGLPRDAYFAIADRDQQKLASPSPATFSSAISVRGLDRRAAHHRTRPPSSPELSMKTISSEVLRLDQTAFPKRRSPQRISL